MRPGEGVEASDVTLFDKPPLPDSRFVRARGGEKEGGVGRQLQTHAGSLCVHARANLLRRPMLVCRCALVCQDIRIRTRIYTSTFAHQCVHVCNGVSCTHNTHTRKYHEARAKLRRAGGRYESMVAFEGPYILHYIHVGFAGTRTKYKRMASKASDLNQIPFYHTALGMFARNNSRSEEEDEKHQREWFRQFAVYPPAYWPDLSQLPPKGEMPQKAGEWLHKASAKGRVSPLCARSLLVRIPGPSELLGLLRNNSLLSSPQPASTKSQYTGGAPPECRGWEDKCVSGAAARRRRITSAFERPVSCLLSPALSALWFAPSRFSMPRLVAVVGESVGRVVLACVHARTLTHTYTVTHAQVDVDEHNCMVARCDGEDVEGGGFWLREGMDVSQGGSCRQDNLFCYSRRHTLCVKCARGCVVVCGVWCVQAVWH